MKKVGTAKAMFKGKTKKVNVYDENGMKVVKPEDLGNMRPRSFKLRFQGNEYKAGLTYDLDEPVYKFRQNNIGGSEEMFDVGKIGKETRVKKVY